MPDIYQYALIGDFHSESANLKYYDAKSNTLHVGLNEDRRGECTHWFNFNLTLTSTIAALNVCIDNAGDSKYGAGWKNYSPFVRRENGWERTVEPGSFVDGAFSFCIRNPAASLDVAWYEPYGVERMIQLVNSRLQGHPGATVQTDKEGFTIARLGDPHLPLICIIGRQHPGEANSSFFVEGVLERLTDDSDLSRSLRESFQFVIVPVMNVAGVAHHLHRYDQSGTDYNRSWALKHPPEAIRQVKAIVEQAYDLQVFADIHGDEVSKINYIHYRLGRGASDRDRAKYELLAERIRTNGSKTFVWKSPAYAKRVLKALVRQRKLVLGSGTTSINWAVRAQPCMALTYELSAPSIAPVDCKNAGVAFVNSLCEAFVGILTGPVIRKLDGR